jgi:lipopolysaccharide biosynthesis glycosyltransferase
MHVVYSSSDSYAEIAGISILSLLENNQDAESIHLYMIDNHISDENKARLESIVSLYGREFSYIQPLDIEKLANTNINIGRWNISTFYRLFLPTLLPEDVDRVLFIDCDTIVLESLTPLCEMDMQGKWLWGVDDCRGEKYRTELGLSPKDNYINNGVLLIDIEAWRQENVEQLFLEYIRDNQGDITYVDQGVQNGVVAGRGKSGLLPPKYNALTVFFDFTYENLIKLRKPPVPMTKEAHREAVEHPAIVHFQSCFKSGVRPWVKGCKHPMLEKYLAYKAKSPWADSPWRPDDRTTPQKLLNFGANIMPQGLMVSCVSFMHTKVYPMVRGLKKKK